MLHTKRYRETCSILQDAGIKVISGDTAGSGNFKLRVEYAGVEAVAFTAGVTPDPRSRKNTLFAVKMALKRSGVTFADCSTDPEAKDRKKATRLNGQEKADFFAFYKAGTGTLLELADLYKIHETTAGTIIAAGERG